MAAVAIENSHGAGIKFNSVYWYWYLLLVLILANDTHTYLPTTDLENRIDLTDYYRYQTHSTAVGQSIMSKAYAGVSIKQ